MIKAVIFDCYGVLAVNGWLPFRKKYFGTNTDLFQKSSELNAQADSGKISYRDFMKQVAELAGVTEAEVRKDIEDNPANEGLFNYIQTSLKPHYKLGLLSNAASNRLEALFGPERVALFDAIALSFETGFIKPDPRAFELISQQLNVKPEECVLIDDNEQYCAAAQEAGMRVVYYVNFHTMKHELEALLSSS